MPEDGSKIAMLEASTIHKIRTDLVISGIASVVKELTENSIDSGATKIDITLGGYGLDYIQVSDNGSGISRSDYKLLATEHATSKISKMEEIYENKTLGFRGEALSALAAIGTLVIKTSTEITEPVGHLLKFAHDGSLKQVEQIVHNRGTTVLFKDLFCKQPVRAGELKRGIKREYAKCVKLVQAYAIVCTNIRIHLSNYIKISQEPRIIVSTSSNTLLGNICEVLGVENRKKLRHFSISITTSESYEVQIYGYMSKALPQCSRSSFDMQFLYINGRIVKIPKLLKAFNDAYFKFVPLRYPLLIVCITAPPHSYDINVAPNKENLILKDEYLIVTETRRQIEDWIESSNSIIDINTVETNNNQTMLPENMNSLSNHTFQPEELSLNPIDTESYTSNYSRSLESSSTNPSKANKLHEMFSTDENTPLKKKVHNEEQSSVKQSYNSNFNSITNNFQTNINSNQSSSKDLYTNDSLFTFSSRPLSGISPPSKPSVHSVPNSNVSIPKPLLPAQHRDHIKNDNKPEFNTSCPLEHGNEQAATFSPKNKPDLLFKDDSVMSNDTDHFKKFNKCFSEYKAVIMSTDDAYVDSTDFINNIKTYDSAYRAFANKPPLDVLPQSLSVDQSACEARLSTLIDKSDFQKMEIIGQFNLGFIVTRLKDDLFVIDQHASDEKHTYENLEKNVILKKQTLITPIELYLTTQQELSLMENLNTLSNMGFKLHKSHDNHTARSSIKLLTLPQYGDVCLGVPELEDTLSNIENGNKSILCSKLRSLLASKACRTSVMIGTRLNYTQMKKIVCNMGTLNHPWNCPHGRPTIRHLADLLQLATKSDTQ